MVNVTRVRFENHENAIGISESEPRVSWSFESEGDERDWVQRSYELEIRRKSGVERGEVQRGEVQRGESMLVPWVGRPLVSG
jgi:alpha-L-rhamnosidase